MFLQVLHHHLRPGEGAEGVDSVGGVGFPLPAPRPNAHFVQDVLQLYFTANIWRKRSRGGGSQREETSATVDVLSDDDDDLTHQDGRRMFPHHTTSRRCRCDRRK